MRGAWLAFRAEHLPAHVAFADLVRMKRAFYAGFGAMLEMLAATVDPCDRIGGGDVAMLMQLDAEVEAFAQSREARTV